MLQLKIPFLSCASWYKNINYIVTLETESVESTINQKNLETESVESTVKPGKQNDKTLNFFKTQLKPIKIC